MVDLTLGCAVVVVENCAYAVEECVVELAAANVDAEYCRQQEVQDEVQHLGLRMV
jgi:hypothetical protein